MIPEDSQISSKVVHKKEEKTDKSKNPIQNVDRVEVEPNLRKSLKRDLIHDQSLSTDSSPSKKLKCSVSVPKIEDGQSASASPVLAKDDNISEVMKKVFSYLDFNSLLMCRLISPTANTVASSTLSSKKKLKLQFEDLKLQHKKGSHASQKTLSDLNQLLKTSQELKLSFPCKNFGFLYNSFESSQYILGNPEFQDFITHHGEHVEELSTTYVESTESCTKKSSEIVIMDQVRQLLTHQTPNLRVFEFGCPAIIAWEDKELEAPSHPRPESCALLPSDPEFQQIKEDTKAEEKLNTKMKVFKYGVSTLNSSKIVETILELCPNLEAIFTGLVNPTNCCLLQPVNRLYLIKQMTIDNDSNSNLEDHIKNWPIFLAHATRLGFRVHMRGIHWSYLSNLDLELVRQLEVILKQMLLPGVELNAQPRKRLEEGVN